MLEREIVGAEQEMVIGTQREGFEFGSGELEEFVGVEKRGERGGVAKKEAVGGGVQ